MIKNIVTSVVAAAIVVVVAVTAFVHPTNTTNTVVTGMPDMSASRNINVGGVVTWYLSSPMRSGAATTTVCSFHSPVKGTLRGAWVRFGNVPATGLTVTIGTSTSVTGVTGTLAAATAVATGTGSGYVAAAYGTSILDTTTYINANLSALSTTTGGSCEAEITQF